MKHKLFLIVGVILFLPLVVKADGVSLKCPDEVEPNVEFSCDIYGDVNSSIYNVDSNISLVNFTYVTCDPDSGLQPNNPCGYNESNNTIKAGLYGLNKLNGNFKFLTLKMKIGDNYTSGKVVVSGTEFSDDTNRIAVGSVEKTIYVKKKVVNNSDSEKVNDNTKNTNNGVGGNNNTGVGTQNQEKNTNNGGSTNTKPSNSGTQNTNKSGTTNNTDKTTNVDDDTNNVDDEEETVEEYKIDFSKGAYLIDLKIKGYDIDFRSDIFQYKIKIGGEKKLKITPVVSSKDVTYTIIDNEDLKDGSIVTIEVIYKEQEIQDYYIKIEKDNKKNNTTFILIGIVIALVIINIVRIFFVRRDKNDV